MTVFAASVMVRLPLSETMHGWPFVCLYASNFNKGTAHSLYIVDCSFNEGHTSLD
jgi:hypothetical protein